MKLLFERTCNLLNRDIPVVAVNVSGRVLGLWVSKDLSCLYAADADMIPDDFPAAEQKPLVQIYQNVYDITEWENAAVHEYESVLVQGMKILRVVSENGHHIWVKQKNLGRLNRAKDSHILMHGKGEHYFIVICSDNDYMRGEIIPAAVMMPFKDAKCVEYDRQHPVAY